MDPSIPCTAFLSTPGDALAESFLSLDAKLLRDTDHRAGSTAVVALVTAGHVIVGNCGDSRAYLCRDDRRVGVQLSTARG